MEGYATIEDRFTPEEQAEWNRQYEQEYGNGGTGPVNGGGESGYYDGYMGEPEVQDQAPTAEINQEQPAPVPSVTETEQPTAPQPSQHWLANPSNFAEVWNKFDADPNYEDEHYSREQVDALYDYYSYKNPGKTMDQWSPLSEDDEFVTKEIEKNNWYDPVREEAIQQAANQNEIQNVYKPEDPNDQKWFEKKAQGSWDDLDWIGKLTAAVTTTDEGLEGTPEWAKKTQAVAKAFSSAMAGPATLKVVGGLAGTLGATGVGAALTNPYVLVGAGLAVGGLTFYSALTGKEIPVFSKFLELSDLADTVTEHALGFGAQTIDMATTNIQKANEDPDDAYGLMNAVNDTVKEVFQNASTMWDTGEYFYEMYGSVGDFAIDVLKEVFKGEEGTKMGEGWFFNRGLNEKQQLEEGTYGAEGMANIREMYDEMDKLGIDKDTQNAIMQQAVINVSGSSGNVSDYVAQMLIDLDIISTPLQNESAGLVSRIAGDQNGIEAARINRGNMLTQLPFVGSIYQAISGEKAPGGLNEWMDTRKQLARSTDVNQLSPADRIFGGIDADGKIKEFARTEKTGLGDMLPESKVAGVGNIANNVLNAYMYDVKDVADIRNRLASLVGEANGDTEYQSGLNNSADVLTVRDGIRYAMQQSDPEVYLKQFESSAEARATLAKAAEALGMEVKDMLSLYSETPLVFEQRVRDYAASHNGMFAGIDVSSGIDPINTIVQGFTTAKEGKGSPLAWDIRQVQYQITTSLIDSMAKYYTEYYGVKPNSVTNTVFDTMKSAQSLLLLGWSPSYFINNVVNNAVTAAAEGVLGFMTPKQINQWMEAFGVTPARFDTDSNAEFRNQTQSGKGGLEAFTEAAAEAKKEGNDKGLKGVLTGINGLLRSANDKLGVFSRMSGKMETLQGNQLTAVAIQQYWGQRWKRGEGFHLMPTALVEAIEEQTPGMTNAIYQAIEGGLNMEQIGKVLFDTYIKPDVGAVMKQVCDNLFRGEAAVYEEVLEKSGVMNEIRERYANCKTDAERAVVMESVKQRLNDYLENLRREDLIQRANNVAAAAEGEGLGYVSQIMSEMEMNHTDFWIRQREEWTKAYTQITEQGLDGPASRSLLADLVAKQRKDWADLYKQEAATAAGVMKGLGFQNEYHARYIGFMNEKNQNWQNFNDAKSRELARAYERANAIRNAAGKGKKPDRIKMNEVWEDFHRNVSELYDQHFEKELEYQAKMDAAFVEGYEYSTGKSGEQLRNNFMRINDIRQRMHDMQHEAHEKTSKMNREDKAKFYEEFNPRYNALIREIGNLGEANARIIDENAGKGYENHAPVEMTAEQTVQSTETMEVNNVQREKAMRERQGFLDRDAIRQGWIDSGRTPFEADLMMIVYDARAEQWARDNGAYPDEFYSQALQLKGIANWMTGGTTVELHDAAGNVYEVDAIRPADINTDKFKNWFGKSIMVDENGKPKIMYHGSPVQGITEFRTEAGLYFTDKEWLAQEYANKKSNQVGEVYPCYLKIEKPFDTRDPECRRIYEQEYYLEYGGAGIQGRGLPDWNDGYDLVEFLKEKGYDYDAVVLDEGAIGGYGFENKDRGISYVVMDPTQIKSIYNGGDWSPYDPNILKQTNEEYIAKYYDKIMAHFGNENFRKFIGYDPKNPEKMTKLVDENKLPRVVFSGSHALFTFFDPSKAGKNTGRFDTRSTNGKGRHYFSYDLDMANTYGAKSLPLFNSITSRYYALLSGEETVSSAGMYKIDNWDSITQKDAINIYNSIRDINMLIEKDIPNLEPELGNILTENLKKAEGIINKEHLSKEDVGILRELYYMEDSIRAAYKESGYTYEVYAYINNPFVVDYNNPENIFELMIHNNLLAELKSVLPENVGKKFESLRECKTIKEVIKAIGWEGDNTWNPYFQHMALTYAEHNGYDAVIFDNINDTNEQGKKFLTKTVCVFDTNNIKSIRNDGGFQKLDPPNMLHQAQDYIKGTFEHADVGNIIRMLGASDVSTMVHESGHLFRRTLSNQLLTEFTTWAGFESVGEFQELEVRYWRNDPTLTDTERNRYIDAEEKFARGFEQYLMDGSAPTPGLKAVFKSFRDYLLDIYKKVKTSVTGNDYREQGEFVFHGANGDEVLNINAEINGVKLRDIFDRMLTDDVQRIPGYQELVINRRTELGQDRHNMRLSDKALTRRAQIEVTRQILTHFGSMEEAEKALKNYDLPWDIDGKRVDDATLYEAIKAAKADAQMNPFAQVERHEVKGTQTYAYSITEANSGKKYQLQYKVVELKDLIPSDIWMGDKLVVNEDYPADIQARHRSADQSDVYAHAANLNPGLLIDEQRAIDSGAPIVGEGEMYVESGNGRVLSLLYAQQNFPDQWQKYQEYLRNSIGDYGIDPQQLDGFENPVLVRERLGGDGVAFAEDANSNRNKSMTASENALTDANKVNMNTLSMLDIQPGESIDTFTTEKNAQASVEWLRSLPEMERSRYSTTNRNGDLILSADGKTRFVNALFATLYATPESMDIIRSFSETSDSNIQALESALKATLPEMARAEGLIQSGSRDASLSITADVMAAAGLLQEARKAGINIHDYLAQSVIPGMERWTPTQALLAGFFGDAKNNVRMLKDFFNAYGEEVYKAGDPNQLSLFSESKTREQMINDALNEALTRRSRDNTNPEGGIPKLNQSVLDSDGKWSSEFAKELDQNLQRTFDDGMSVPLDKADGVYLRGDVNVPYETRVQRWLRDFSNEKNLTADQYLYAWSYLEWWVQGSEGEAPKGNPLWEADMQQLIMRDFTQEHGDLVRELQRRYQKGAEVDETAAPNRGEYVKRVYGFEHGFWNIAGNVYKDGKLVAYLPEELSSMKRTIDVDGQSYRVLGVDLNNPEGLVYYDPVLEIVRTVIAGKPEGFEESRNGNAFIRPARQGSTPQTMPVAEAYGELSTKYLFPALNEFTEAYNRADQDAKTSKLSGLNMETRALIAQWLDQDVSEDMRVEKYRAMKYSDMKKDAAMLNYNQRYGFDPLLTMINPYQFWYTRSMWKWAKRMIDKPALGNAYERMQEYEDKNRQENLPSRLAGRWRIPMPFLPDWMGGSYYIDLNSQLFPFAQFGESYGSTMNQATLNARAEAILNEQADAELITPQEMQQALKDKSGAIWENAFAQAELEIGKNNGLSTLAQQFYSPSIFFTWAGDKQKGEDPGMLSGTRTGNAIKALTKDVPLVGTIGSIVGDAMTIPERALRKLYGFEYNEFGSYGDQQIRKQISQMCADGEIDWRKALNAMNEKSGTIWEMAADRQRKEAMLKVPGFGGLEAVKQFANGNASVGDVFGSMAISLLGGGSIYPTGEKTLREAKAARDEAYLRQAAGDKAAVSEWYKDNANYTTRTATYIDDPEELLKYTLYQNITTQYYAQPYAQQQQILNDLGPEFYYAVFKKETRNYKAVPIQKLAEWNASIGNKNPNVGSIDVQGVERVMQLSEPVIDVVEQHDTEKDKLYPGISVIQDGYYALPKDQRKSYLQSFPQLESYWEWNRQFQNEHPEYVRWNKERSAFYNESTCYETYAAMSQRTQKELEYVKATGSAMSDSAIYELEHLYQRYANQNFLSFADYIKLLQDYQ